MITGVTASPASSTVVALNDVTLTCSPTTTPDTYSWHRVDGDLPSSSTGQSTNRLTLHNVVPADEGQYYCMATLFGHCAVSNNVTVTVEGIRNDIIRNMYKRCTKSVFMHNASNVMRNINFYHEVSKFKYLYIYDRLLHWIVSRALLCF